jgi:phosphoribosylformylglycinamidine synthase subunit PurS
MKYDVALRGSGEPVIGPAKPDPLGLAPQGDVLKYWAGNMKARVTVTLKSGILDPQGKAIEGALKSLGVDGVASVRQGKVFDIELSGSDKAKAEAALKDAADKLLANTVIENYRVEVLG